MRARALAGVLAVVAAATAGCGSSAASSSTRQQGAPSGRPPQIDSQALGSLEQCLQKHGVSLPSGGGSPSGSADGQQGQPPTLDKKTQTALRECSQYLPSQP